MAQKPMATRNRNATRLYATAQFALFASSYMPLFIMIIARQVYLNFDYLHYAGISVPSLIVFLQRFGLSSVLVILSLFGWFGYRVTFKNLEEAAKNGIPVRVKEVKNKNNESIGYIATYIIPFLFQDVSGLLESASVFFLLLIIYRIYINSTLILVNPLLGLVYSVYELKFEDGGIKRDAFVLSRDKDIQEEDVVKIYPIGSKLYFSIPEFNNDN